MLIVGCDFHPSWQQIAICDSETGEVNEHQLSHSDGEAERFYRELPAPARIGLEACGNSQWLVNRLQELGHEVWIGDAAQIRASYVRKQKPDKRDAMHILKLLLEDRFPRLWTPTAEMRNQQAISTPLPPQAQGCGQSGSGSQVGRTPLLDAAHPDRVSRDRSHREPLEGGPGRPNRQAETLNERSRIP